MFATDLVEVEFKGNRKVVYANSDELHIKNNDYVIVKANKGFDMGQVSKVGRLVQMKDTDDIEDLQKIIRVASEQEEQNIRRVRDKEEEASIICKQKIQKLDLHMKLVDVEMQFDGNKLTFYFTSDKRVDFRVLVKELASHFKTRIELRQIGVRDEARRIGGCGNCGRPLCCSSFLKEFEPITTQYAKDQNLPLNPGKLSGSCGRLMCCLSYEREYYQDSLKKYPTLDSHYKGKKYKFIILKLDVFNETITIRTSNDEYFLIPLAEFDEKVKNNEYKLISTSEYQNA